MARSATPRRGGSRGGGGSVGGGGVEKGGGGGEKTGVLSESRRFQLAIVGIVGLVSLATAVALYPVGRHVLGLVSGGELLETCRSTSNPTVFALTAIPLTPHQLSTYTAPGWGGWSCLHVLADRGDASLVDFLLSRGANPNAVDDKGRTPLMLAAVGGHADVVHSLSRTGANPSKFDLEGFQALHWAAMGGKEDAVQAVLDMGVSADTATSRGETALMLAARIAPPHLTFGVLDVLAAHGADINAIDPSTGCTALHRAVVHAPLSAVLALLDAGANPSGVPSQCPQSPLSFALLHRRTDVARALVAQGADVSGAGPAEGAGKAGKGLPPLHAAAMTGQLAMVQLLAESGAALDQVDPASGRTALHAGVLGGQSGVALFLARLLALAHKKSQPHFEAVLTTPDTEGATAVMRAAGSGEADSVRALLAIDSHTPAEGGKALIPRQQRGGIVEAAEHVRVVAGGDTWDMLSASRKAQVFAQDKLGRTAFHYAASGGSLGVLTTLLEAVRLVNVTRSGAEQAIAAQDALGRNPIYTAIDHGYCGLILDRLVSVAPKAIHAKAKDGMSAVLRAAAEGRVECVEKLVRFGASLNDTISETTTPPTPSSSSSSTRQPTPQAPKTPTLFSGTIAPGASTLHMAALSDSVPLARLVLRQFPQQLQVLDAKGRSPLHTAATAGSLSFLSFLRDLHQFSPASPAPAVASLLQDSPDDPLGDDGEPAVKGADRVLQIADRIAPAAVTAEGATALHLLSASAVGLERASQLRKSAQRASSPLQAPSADASTLLTAQAAEELGSVVGWIGAALEEAGEGGVNARDAFKRTPLHTACAFGNTAVAVALAQVGADPNLQDQQGHRPFDLAPADVAVPARSEIPEEEERMQAEVMVHQAQERDARRRLVETLRRHRLAAARNAKTRIPNLTYAQFKHHNNAMGYTEAQLQNGFRAYLRGMHHLLVLHSSPREAGLLFSGFERHNMRLAFSREEFRVGWLNYIRGMHHRMELQGVPRRQGLSRAEFGRWNAYVNASEAELEAAFTRYSQKRAHHLMHLQYDVDAANAAAKSSSSLAAGTSAMLPEARRLGLRFEDFAEFNAGQQYTTAELRKGYERYLQGQLHLMHLQTDDDRDVLFARSSGDIFDLKNADVSKESILAELHQKGVVPLSSANETSSLGFTVADKSLGRKANLTFQQYRRINAATFSAQEIREGYERYLKEGAHHDIARQKSIELDKEGTRKGVPPRVDGLWYFHFGAANDGQGYDRYELETGFVRYNQGDHHFILYQKDGGKAGQVKGVHRPK